MSRFFTSESVTEGHPDKICDQISDAILDAVIAQDKKSRVAIECVATTGLVHVLGELSTADAYVDIPNIVRKTLKKIGYTSSEIGFDANSCGVLVSIDEQSPDIAQGVDQKINNDEDVLNSLGAGDQGVMFGYATNETNQYYPLSAQLAHKMAKRLAQCRFHNIINHLRPDGKTQVTVEYNDNNIPVGISKVVISTQHDDGIDMKALERNIKHNVVDYVLSEVSKELDYNLEITKYDLIFNPTGKFVIGGPQGDTGLTGRKIIVDTYGSFSRHGGGCFSGKDPSKVDRSGAYCARWIAKNLVAAGIAQRLEVQIAYAIGVVYPVSVYVEAFGTEKYPIDLIEKVINKVFDLRPAAIIKDLDLLRPIYQNTATYGHFGRYDYDFPWERLNKVEDLKSAIIELGE